MNSRPQATLVVCAFNGERCLPACLRSIAAQTGAELETIIVDNASSDGSTEIVRRDFPQFRLIRNERNLGFGSGNNVGIRAASGKEILLLNQDAEIPPDWAARMLGVLAAEPRAGAVGCKLVFPDGAVQHAGGIIYPNGATAHLGYKLGDGEWNTAGPRTYVTAAAIALRRAALEQVGLFDPIFDPAYFEEVDLELRMWNAGWKVLCDPSIVAVHNESASMGAGSPDSIALQTRHRFAHIALHGLPNGRAAAMGWEMRWLGDMLRKGRLGAAFRGYRQAAGHWRAWRRERDGRPGLPRLEPLRD